MNYNHKCSVHGLWGHALCSVPDVFDDPCMICSYGNFESELSDVDRWEFEDEFAVAVAEIRREAGME